MFLFRLFSYMALRKKDGSQSNSAICILVVASGPCIILCICAAAYFWLRPDILGQLGTLVPGAIAKCEGDNWFQGGLLISRTASVSSPELI